MAAFILVHGTFAKSAHWPELQDGLVETASAAGERSRFEQQKWTGRNRASARQAATAGLLSLVQTLQLASPEEKLFLIGHSHGGSAIAYFLKAYPEVAKTLTGCAFLSTPFVAIRPRAGAFQVIFAVTFFPFFAIAISWMYANGIEWQNDWRPTDYFFALGRAHYLGLGALIALPTLASFVFRSFIADKLISEALRGQTADLPPGNYLFLRCSGDEAAAALSAAQFVTWLGMKCARLLQSLTRLWSGSHTVGRIVGFVMWWLFHLEYFQQYQRRLVGETFFSILGY